MLDIIYEDNELLVIDKPASLNILPNKDNANKNLCSIIKNYYLSQCKPPKFLAPAHRLDQNTTGVIIFCRSRLAMQEVCRQFANQTVHKEYIAVVNNVPNFIVSSINLSIGRRLDDFTKPTILPMHLGGKTACTNLYLTAKYKNYSLIKAVPLTGRRHQIRLHLAAINLPIVGDRSYNPQNTSMINRQALHAEKIQIVHPKYKEKILFTAPIPTDIIKLIKTVEKT